MGYIGQRERKGKGRREERERGKDQVDEKVWFSISAQLALAKNLNSQHIYC